MSLVRMLNHTLLSVFDIPEKYHLPLADRVCFINTFLALIFNVWILFYFQSWEFDKNLKVWQSLVIETNTHHALNISWLHNTSFILTFWLPAAVSWGRSARPVMNNYLPCWPQFKIKKKSFTVKLDPYALIICKY